MQKTRLANPPLFFNQFRVHNGNLPAGSSEAYKPELEPKSECFPERRVFELAHLARRLTAAKILESLEWFSACPACTFPV